MNFDPGRGVTRVRLVFHPILGFLCEAARMFKEIQDQKLLDLDRENGLADIDRGRPFWSHGPP